MNVGYFKNQTFKAQDGKEIKFIGGMINIPFTRQYIKLYFLNLKNTRGQGKL